MFLCAICPLNYFNTCLKWILIVNTVFFFVFMKGWKGNIVNSAASIRNAGSLCLQDVFYSL